MTPATRPAWHGRVSAGGNRGAEMIGSRFSWPATVVLTIVALAPWMKCATGQEIGLTPLETNEVARGYRAETIKLRPVVNDKNETIGRINDFIFGKDGNIYAVLAVGDFTGLAANLSLFPSVALTSTVPPAILCCQAPAAMRFKSCRFSLAVDNSLYRYRQAASSSPGSRPPISQ
jgi:hypothetical protein